MPYRSTRQLLRFEWQKAQHSRTVVGMSLVCIGFSGLPVITSYSGTTSTSIAFPGAASQAVLAEFLFFGAILAGLLGAMFVYDEFRCHTDNLILTAGYSRVSVALSKMAVVVLWMPGTCIAQWVFVILAGEFNAILAYHALIAPGIQPVVLAGQYLLMATYALLAYAVSYLFHSTVAGAVFPLALLFGERSLLSSPNTTTAAIVS